MAGPPRVLGISALYHDSAAALVCGEGTIAAAAQEERFTRIKHDARFPDQAIRFCLDRVQHKLSDLDAVVFYEKPFLKFERLLETYATFAPRGFESFRLAVPLWIREKLFQKDLLLKELRAIDPDFNPDRLLFTEHHMSHAASAFYPSPFDDAAILTMDGVGEWCTTSIGRGTGADIQLLREIHFPHSLGLLYSAFTYYCGFKVNSGEYKLMGLAPYGTARFQDQIFEHLIDVKSDGSFRLNLDYFNFATGLTMTNGAFSRLWGRPPRKPDQLLDQSHMDLAASIQAVTEEVVRRLARTALDLAGSDRLCLAGGVALNCVANGKLWAEKVCRNLWIQPASGDAGGALGAALTGLHVWSGAPRRTRTRDTMQGSYLGPEFSQDHIEDALRGAGARFETCRDDSELAERTAADLASGRAIGWFQGRMEFGPRALGARSILGDARSPTMQRLLNLKVKYRESFRPFAPAVLREHVGEWFDLETDSPYMLLVAPVSPRLRRAMTPDEERLFGIDKLNIVRSEIPAVTHVDYSARIQTVHADSHPLFHRLITAFHRATGCPVVVNTSFNVRGEPIVHSPVDAFRCFMGTDIERLAIGRCLLRKEDQDPALARSYKDAFALD